MIRFPRCFVLFPDLCARGRLGDLVAAESDYMLVSHATGYLLLL